MTFSLDMEVRRQHKTDSKFLINANFLHNNNPVTTTLLWNTEGTLYIIYMKMISGQK